MYKQMSVVGLVFLGVSGCNVAEGVDSSAVAQEATVEVISSTGTVVADEVTRFGPVDLPVGSSLEAVLALTSGDADLYVRTGQLPTLYQYDCRPYFGGASTETCDSTTAGLTYIDVIGYSRSSDYSLTVTVTSEGETCGNATLDPGEACDGKPSACSDIGSEWAGGTGSCLSDCSGWDTSTCVAAPPSDVTEQYFSGGINEGLGKGQWRHYGPFNTVSGDFRALIGHNPDGNPGTGDVDLYVRSGAAPTANLYDCKSDASGSQESCTVPGGGLVYVSIFAYDIGPQLGSANYAFEAYYFADTTTMQPTIIGDVNVVDKGMWFMYGPYDGSNATVEITLAGRGDSDLYVRSGAAPTEGAWDCRPYKNGPDEACVLSNPNMFWVGVRGYSSSPAYFEVRSVVIAN